MKRVGDIIAIIGLAVAAHGVWHENAVQKGIGCLLIFVGLAPWLADVLVSSVRRWRG